MAASSKEAESTDDSRNADGVDVSLIEMMLDMTPEERLEYNDRMIQTISELQSAFQRTVVK